MYSIVFNMYGIILIMLLSIECKWGGSVVMGLPNHSWMVFVRENPIYKWMMTRPLEASGPQGGHGSPSVMTMTFGMSWYS